MQPAILSLITKRTMSSQHVVLSKTGWDFMKEVALVEKPPRIHPAGENATEADPTRSENARNNTGIIGVFLSGAVIC